jgi:hypothetical protein
MQKLQKQFALSVWAIAALTIVLFAAPVHADMCEPSWHSLSGYKAGNKISFLDVNYRANYPSAGVVPSSNSGDAQKGKAWSKIGLCGNKAKNAIAQTQHSVTQKVADR